MNYLLFWGVFLLLLGVFDLRTYIKRRQWPTVKGTLDSVDVKIQATGYGKGMGFFVRPRYNQKIKYSYHDNQYEIEIKTYEIKKEALQLRVNPDKPSEAFVDDKTLNFPVIAISIGIVLILLSINGETNRTK